MSCQDVVDAAQAVVNGLDHDMPVSLAALAEALEAYREEKRFGTVQQVFEHYIPDYEKPVDINPWYGWR